MLAYLIRRLLWLPLLLIIVSFITFTLGYYGPADPIVALLGQHYDPEIATQLAREYGFDQPFAVQYLKYLERIARLDFGESIKYRNQPVLRLLIPRLAITIQLNAVSSFIGVVLGIGTGVTAALWRGKWVDRLVVFGVVFGRAIPVFVAGPILLFLFARTVPVLPAGGWDGIFSRSAVLPVVLLSIGPMAIFARQTRSGMLEVMGQDYIRTARAKGLREVAVVTVHALRNAFIPLLTILGFLLGSLVEGTFLTETIFGIPGMGQFAFEALGGRDYPVIITVTLLVAVAYALGNLWVDVLYGVVDPRIRQA
ncbi:MAG: ABC transporter permease [Anaerolineales bacterium]|nr:MAG: ABC transporter permease [Anaerolineales bacterium]